MSDNRDEPPVGSLIESAKWVFYREDAPTDPWRFTGYDGDGETRDVYVSWGEVQRMTQGEWKLTTWDDL